MKNSTLARYTSCLTLLFVLPFFSGMAQPPSPGQIQERLPEGTTIHGNIPYHNDTLQKHLLDLYIPSEAEKPVPLVVFIHGGGWISNDKYADMGYMPNTINAMLDNGMAIASIDYRFAQDAIFPGILQDCNKAVSFLYDHAGEYGLDTSNIGLMGFSAGGHLAALMGTSQNNEVEGLHVAGSYRPFRYQAVVDFYGPTDLVLLPGNEDEKSPEGILIGAAPLLRPDLAKAASPITYIDPEDPPFLIFHGEKDNIVSNKQSKLFSAWLDIHGVENELTIVADAPHFGNMYDVEEIRSRVIAFLNEHLK
ncbi:alpha/beta hydrolase [Robiginitalea biformata]|nr:alpha/beta hydrolase [Robiginitalea biformata]